MNCNVKITAVGTADGLEVSIHGGSVGMMTAAELIVARVLMAVADDEENLAGLKDSMFEIDLVAEPRGWRFVEHITPDTAAEIKAWKKCAQQTERKG